MTRRSTPLPQPPDQPRTQATASKPDPRPVLLATRRDAEQIQVILSAYSLHDIDQADRNLQAMAGDPHQRRQLADILPILMESIARTADPD